MLKLAFVSHSLPTETRPDENIGGMQRVSLELHSALLARDHIRYLPIMLRSTWAATHRRVPLFLIRTLFSLRRLIRSGDVDAILYSSMVTASLDPLLRRLRTRHGVKSAAIVHGLDVTTPVRIYQKFVPRVFRSLDLAFPVSRATADACIERGLADEKAFVVPNGVDVSRFVAPDAEGVSAGRKTLARLAGRESWPTGGLLLVSVGRHVKRKGFVWFVESVMPLLPDDVHYVVAGEGPESAAIRNAAQRVGCASRVHLPGTISELDLPAVYAAADLFIMPNVPVPGDMEGFGVVLLEAGLSGTPAVAAALEGILDVISPGSNGVLVSTGDSEGFVENIMRFYGRPDLLAEASIRAREYTLRTFGWDAVAERYISLVDTLAETLTGTPPVETPARTREAVKSGS